MFYQPPSFNRLLYSIVFLFVLILEFSCNGVLSVVSGVHKPKEENVESILAYVHKIHINDSNICIPVSREKWKKLLLDNKKIPEIKVFDQSGNNIKYKDDHLCNAQAFEFSEKICDLDCLIIAGNYNLGMEVKDLVDINGRAIQASDFLDYDYIVCIYWAKFIGKLNKNHVKIWEENISKQENCKIKVLKVNLDMQKTWGIN